MTTAEIINRAASIYRTHLPPYAFSLSLVVRPLVASRAKRSVRSRSILGVDSRQLGTLSKRRVALPTAASARWRASISIAISLKRKSREFNLGRSQLFHGGCYAQMAFEF